MKFVATTAAFVGLLAASRAAEVVVFGDSWGAFSRTR